MTSIDTEEGGADRNLFIKTCGVDRVLGWVIDQPYRALPKCVSSLVRERNCSHYVLTMLNIDCALNCVPLFASIIADRTDRD